MQDGPPTMDRALRSRMSPWARGEVLCRSASAGTGTEPPRRKGFTWLERWAKVEQAESKGTKAGRWGPCVKGLELLTSWLNSELSLGRRGGRGAHVINFHVQRFFYLILQEKGN